MYAQLRDKAAQLADTDSADIARIRAIIDTLAISARPLPGVELISCNDGTTSGVWVVPRGADPDRRIVFCHGCSFIAGSIDLYAGMLSRLGAAANASVFFVNYRLAPEHTFPAAHDDCMAAFRWVRANGVLGAGEASACFLAGDSAGACLALNAALVAAREGEGANAVVVFSPFVDLTLSGASCASNDGRDPITSVEAARACVATYAPGVDPRDERLSPLFADLSGLTKVQVHGAGLDPLLDDAIRLADRARSSGVDAELHLWGDVPHFWYLFHEELPQARVGMIVTGEFLRRD